MTDILCFSNPGELPIRALTTLGVNAKECGNPMGYFGTGLKYALACLLRNGQNVTINSGMIQLTFDVRWEKIRGKEFGIIYMKDGYGEQALGFTTDLGKHWQPWQIYRELYSNSVLDEGGKVDHEVMKPVPGRTSIIIEGDYLSEVHSNRHEFIIPVELSPIYETSEFQAYPGKSDYIFYRGVRAGTLECTSSYTYNILSPQDLTEDRTLQTMYLWRDNLAGFLVSDPEARLQELFRDNASFESRLDFLSEEVKISDAWGEVLKKIVKDDAFKLPLSLVHRCRKFNIPLFADKQKMEEAASPELKERIDKARRYLNALGIPCQEPEVVSDNQLSNPYGSVPYIVDHGQSADNIASELVLQYMERVRGCTRYHTLMETFLVEQLVVLAKEKLSERPL